MPFKSKDCVHCGTVFTPIVWNQKMCGPCADIKRPGRRKPKLEVSCRYCGKEFKRLTARQKFCSSSCSDMSSYYVRNYGVTKRDVVNLVKDQEGKCAICQGAGWVMDSSRHSSNLCVDHDHKTGKVRGMLCHNCNRALGLLKDSPTILQAAIDYLADSK